MRKVNLISKATLECGHVMEVEIKHNVRKAWCDECEERKTITNDGLFHAKCNACRFGAKESDQRHLARRAGYHAETKHHTVEIYNSSGVSVALIGHSAVGLV